MREVITPWLAKQAAQPDGSLAKQSEAAREATARRLEIARLQLVKAFKGVKAEDRRTIRMHVALSLPEQPMTREQVQLWLDERCIGVAKYMVQGSIL